MRRVLIFTFACFSQDFFSLIGLSLFLKPDAPSSLFNEPDTFKSWCCGVPENFGRLAGDESQRNRAALSHSDKPVIISMGESRGVVIP